MTFTGVLPNQTLRKSACNFQQKQKKGPCWETAHPGSLLMTSDLWCRPSHTQLLQDKNSPDTDPMPIRYEDH